MMGRTSREKGARGERQIRDLFRRYGFTAHRDGTAFGDLRHSISGDHVEVKLCEAYEFTKWLCQVEDDRGELHGTLYFRRSRERWRVVVDAEEYVRLKALERERA